MRLEEALAYCPAVAILRGVQPDEVLGIAQALFDAGLRAVEVPLNSPDPFNSIARLQKTFGESMIVGAGTVRSAYDLQQLSATGAQLAVSPHTDPLLIAEALRMGLLPLPGFQTASEAFAAIAAGARWLKLFPATGREADLRALRSVLPRDVRVLAVGGSGPEQGQAWLASGANGLGVGSELYQAGMNAVEVATRARKLVSALLQPPQLLAQPRAVIGESPIWCSVDARIRWVDPLAQRLHSVCADGTNFESKTLPRAVWSIDLANGVLVGASDAGFCRLDSDFFNGPPAPQPPGCRLNDMAVDKHGGLWAGSMHRGLLNGRGSLVWAASPEHAPVCIATGLGVPNGMCFSADGSTFYLVDTLARTLLAYPVKGPGELGEPRVISDFMGQPGKPDGMCLADDGTLWVAMWGGGSLLQLAHDGAILRRLPVPTPQVSSCCELPDGRLVVSCSTMRLSTAQLSADTLAGALLGVQP